MHEPTGCEESRATVKRRLKSALRDPMGCRETLWQMIGQPKRRHAESTAGCMHITAFPCLTSRNNVDPFGESEGRIARFLEVYLLCPFALDRAVHTICRAGGRTPKSSRYLVTTLLLRPRAGAPADGRELETQGPGVLGVLGGEDFGEQRLLRRALGETMQEDDGVRVVAARQGLEGQGLGQRLPKRHDEQRWRWCELSCQVAQASVLPRRTVEFGRMEAVLGMVAEHTPPNYCAAQEAGRWSKHLSALRQPGNLLRYRVCLLLFSRLTPIRQRQSYRPNRASKYSAPTCIGT